MRLWTFALVGALLPAPAVAGSDDPSGYVLEPGDIVEFAVTGIPDIGRKVQVDTDGLLSLPLVGEVKAAGLSLARVRADLRSAVSRKQYRSRPLPGQRDADSVVVWPDQVSLTVSEYRPVYLNGDVAKPGSVAFRPGMDLRQALSLAGGYDILRFRMENPFLVASDIRGSYESAWIEFARDQATLLRLRSELAETAANAPANPPAKSAMTLAPHRSVATGGHAAPLPSDLTTTPPIPASLLVSIRASEASLKTVRDTEFAQKKFHADALVKQDDEDIASLTQRRNAEMDNSRYDEVEFRRIQDVFRQGTMPMTRVADARRIMLLSSTQALQSAVELEKTKSDREVHRHDAEAVTTDRRIELLKAEQDAQLKLADDRVRIQALGDKLLYTGALKSQLVRGTGGEPDLMLFRGNAAGVPVHENQILEPGDVVEVSLHVAGVPAGASTLR